MENLKSSLIWIVILAVIIGGGYLAFTTLDTGPDFAKKTADRLAEEARMEEEAARALAELENKATETTEAELPPEESVAEQEPAEISSEAQKIKTDLEDLLARKITLEPGDSGVSVLPVQKFLNYYDKDLNMKEDQDFGPSTRASVEKFQKDQGISPDGGVGPQTISKMINFLSR